MNDEELHQMRDASTLLNAIGAVVWEFDWSTGAFTFVSDACERLLGHPRERWLEPGFWMEKVHPDDIGDAAEYCKRSTAQGVDHVFEYRMVRADGGIVWVRDIVTVDPVKRLDGVLRGLLVDITDTKRKAEHFDAVFRLMRDLFFRVDKSGVIVEYASPDGTDLYVPPELFLQRPLVDVLPAGPAAVLTTCTEEAVRTGQMSVGEYVLEMQGEQTEWEARVLPLRDGETAVVCRDITIRRRQEREIEAQRDDLDRAVVELRASETRFRSVVERAPIGMHVYELRDDDAVLVSANAAADAVLGIDHSPLIGMTAREAFPAGGEWIDAYRHLAQSGGEWHADVPYSDDAIKGVFQVTAFQTTPGQVAVMFTDVTEQKAIANAEREHSRRVSALAAQIASAEDTERRRLAEELHDRVSQPLAVARLRLRSATDACPHDYQEAQQALDLLEQAIHETRTITTELFPPILAELGLAAALGWLTDEACRLHHLRCETRFEETDGLSDEVEAFLFRTARELLMNVVKHARTSSVWISLDRLGEEIALTVEDDGRGFDSQALAGPSADSGFGLFSISERIGYLGGSVDVESTPGQGTRITVTVPIHRPAV